MTRMAQAPDYFRLREYGMLHCPACPTAFNKCSECGAHLGATDMFWHESPTSHVCATCRAELLDEYGVTPREERE